MTKKDNSKYTKEILEPAVKASICYRDVLRVLGIKINGGPHAHIKKRIQFYGIDTSHFQGIRAHRSKCIPKKLHWSEILVYDPSYGRRRLSNQLRRALIDSGREYKCEVCQNYGIWNNQSLRLHVDHIDNNWLDNRLENIRFLCPNCHSQTLGYGCQPKFKPKVKKPRVKKPPHYCKDCFKPLTKRKTVYCRACIDKHPKLHARKCLDRPSPEQLQKDILELGYVGTGRKYGVSDNAVRKWKIS